MSQQVAVCCGLPTMARQPASRTMLCSVSAPSRKLIGTGMTPRRQRPQERGQKPDAVGNRNDASFTSAQADRRQRLGCATHLGLELRVGVGLRLGFAQVDDGDIVGMVPRRLIEEDAEIDDLEVALDPLDDRRCMDT